MTEKAKAPEAKVEQTFLCEVLRDFWPTENEADRVRAGDLVEVGVETAMDGIERGVLARVK